MIVVILLLRVSDENIGKPHLPPPDLLLPSPLSDDYIKSWRKEECVHGTTGLFFHD